VIRGLSIVYVIYLLLPMALLLIGSFGANWTNTLLPTGFTTSWYVNLWTDPSFTKAFVSSFFVAVCTCIVNSVLALPLAYSLYCNNSKGSAFAARVISSMPIAVPTITLGFGYMIVFNSDLAPWLGSMPLLIAAHAVHTLPYLTNALLMDLRHLRIEALEEAAATLGATPIQQFFSVVVPSLKQSLLSGLVMVAAISVGEFGLSNLLTSFQNRTYPVVLLQAFYGATGFACAASVILLLLAALSALVSSSSLQSKKSPA
jgi:putative spermidine/putrescine transport system permease protein